MQVLDLWNIACDNNDTFIYQITIFIYQIYISDYFYFELPYKYFLFLGITHMYI